MVLVVDDEFLIRWSLKEHLTDAGYKVLEAEDGKGALAHFAAGKEPVKLVLLDLKLPDLDGVEVLKRIKNTEPSCHVVMMSAQGTPEKREAARQAGAHSFVDKPFDYSAMVRKAEEILGK